MPTTRSRKRAEPEADLAPKTDDARQTDALRSVDPNISQELPAPKKARHTRKNPSKAQTPVDTAESKGDSERKEIAQKSSNEPQEVEVTSTPQLVIPLDEFCPHNSHSVHIDDDGGIIYDAALNQTQSGANANKFYRIQLLVDHKGDYRTWTRWGRVGEAGQNATLGNGTFEDARLMFVKKFKDKTGLKWEDRTNNAKPGKYVFIERNYEPDSEEPKHDKAAVDPADSGHDVASPPPCTLAAPVKSLMELIFNAAHMENTMADFNYDAKKLPLGKLSQNTMSRGYEALKSLAELIGDPSRATSLGGTFESITEEQSNLYYSYIPHNFGWQRPPVIRDSARLKKEIELLDSLSDMKVADSLLKATSSATDNVNVLDRHFKSLNLEEMTPLQPQTDEHKLITEYLNESRGATHGYLYDVVDVFRIERQGETERFQSFKVDQSDRRLLWHGSRSTNFGGILSQGLRIAPPEAPVNGYMFGKGLYLADMSSKSAGYCCAHISDGHALLLLCEAELGDPMLERTQASSTAGEEALRQGSFSTWGQGSTGPSIWKDAGCVHSTLKGVRMPDMSIAPGPTNVPGASLFYNEYICYDTAQVRLRYLLRVKM